MKPRSSNDDQRLRPTHTELQQLVVRQLGSLVIVDAALERAVLAAIPRAVEQYSSGVERLSLSRFGPLGTAPLDPHHSDQWAMFLYVLARTAVDDADTRLATDLYRLNKSLHAVDLFYEVELPSVFLLSHPVGTVLGRANYGDYFVAYQRCTVGSDLLGRRPRLGEGVVLFGDAVVIGDVVVGDNVWVGAGARVLGGRIPSDTVVKPADAGWTTEPAKHLVKDWLTRDDSPTPLPPEDG